MPSTPTGPGAPQYPAFWVTHTNGVEFKIEPYTAIATEADLDTATQDLVTHLQSWPELATSFTVTATKIDTEGNAITA